MGCGSTNKITISKDLKILKDNPLYQSSEKTITKECKIKSKIVKLTKNSSKFLTENKIENEKSIIKGIEKNGLSSRKESIHNNEEILKSKNNLPKKSEDSKIGKQPDNKIEEEKEIVLKKEDLDKEEKIFNLKFKNIDAKEINNKNQGLKKKKEKLISSNSKFFIDDKKLTNLENLEKISNNDKIINKIEINELTNFENFEKISNDDKLINKIEINKLTNFENLEKISNVDKLISKIEINKQKDFSKMNLNYNYNPNEEVNFFEMRIDGIEWGGLDKKNINTFNNELNQSFNDII